MTNELKWTIQMELGRCDSSECTTPDIVPGEPVRLVFNGRKRWCWMCARKRLFEKPPANVAPPVPRKLKIHVEQGKFVEENFTGFDRGAVGGELRNNILSRRELERANANDGRLKAAGGDE